MATIAQAITDAWGLPGRARPGLGARIGNKLRRRVVKFYDPPVRFRVGKADLQLPFSHELPYYRWAHPLYDTALERLARAAAAHHPDGTILDIGANVGDSAALFRAGCEYALLCVEGDPRFARHLESNASRIGGRVIVERAFVGAHDGFVAARAVSRGGGTARLQPAGDARTPVLSAATLLARHADLPPLRIVKVDTDGFDWAILEAGLDVWAERRPVLFFECDPVFYEPEWDPRPLLRRLASIGYGTLLAYQNTGELVGAVDLSDARAVTSLHGWLRGRRGAAYLDLCTFHRTEARLADGFVESEFEAVGVRSERVDQAGLRTT